MSLPMQRFKGGLGKVEGCRAIVVDSPEDVGVTVDLGGPFGLATVAFALIGRHRCFCGCEIGSVESFVGFEVDV